VDRVCSTYDTNVKTEEEKEEEKEEEEEDTQ
jgi:hypothetical protein